MKIQKRKRTGLRKISLLAVVTGLLIGVGGLYYFLTQYLAAPQPGVSSSITSKVSKNPSATSTFEPLSEIPLRITIKKIEVDAVIEPLGLTDDGLMDAPKTNEGVGWYNKSARAGEDTYAVLLDGHYGTKARPAVFYRLAELVIGDEITVTGQKGSIFTYQVVEKEQQYVYDVDMKKAFNLYPNTEQSLTLITCEGKFDAASETYEKRTILYAKRIK